MRTQTLVPALCTLFCLFLGGKVLAQPNLPSPYESIVKCESRDHEHEYCDVYAGKILAVQVDDQLSNTKCESGKNFGFINEEMESYLWVDDGCRAKFKVYSAPSFSYLSYMGCRDTSEIKYEFRTFHGLGCKDREGRIKTIRDISLDRCEEKCAGKEECAAFTYNHKNEDCYLKAQCNDIQESDNDITGFKIQTDFNQKTYCDFEEGSAAPGSVQLVKTVSDKSCDKGETWGVNQYGVWVSEGCEGIFAYVPR